jgi:hypothetical protein
MTRYPLYRRLGGPQGRSGRVREISPPPGLDIRTVQPVQTLQHAVSPDKRHTLKSRLNYNLWTRANFCNFARKRSADTCQGQVTGTCPCLSTCHIKTRSLNIISASITITKRRQLTSPGLRYKNGHSCDVSICKTDLAETRLKLWRTSGNVSTLDCL